MSLRLKAYYHRLGFRSKAAFQSMGLKNKLEFFRGKLEETPYSYLQETKQALLEILNDAEQAVPVLKGFPIKEIAYECKNLLLACKSEKRGLAESLIKYGRLINRIDNITGTLIWLNQTTRMDLIYSNGISNETINLITTSPVDLYLDELISESGWNTRVYTKSNQSVFRFVHNSISKIDLNPIRFFILSPMGIEQTFLGVMLLLVHTSISDSDLQLLTHNIDVASLLISQCYFIQNECQKDLYSIF